MAIVGAALWIRTALVQFWRFWMLRSLYEGQAHLDEVVKAITRPLTRSAPSGPHPRVSRAGGVRRTLGSGSSGRASTRVACAEPSDLPDEARRSRANRTH